MDAVKLVRKLYAAGVLIYNNIIIFYFLSTVALARQHWRWLRLCAGKPVYFKERSHDQHVN